MNDESLEGVFVRLAHEIEHHEQEVIAGSELSALTETQITYLDMIGHLPEPTITELAAALRISKPTATIAVDRLGQLGLVMRVRSDSDRRCSHIHLTESGHRLADLHNRVHGKFARLIADALPTGEAQTLARLLSKAMTRLEGGDA